MAKFEAGTAFVQVVPSLRDFHKTIGQALKGLDNQVALPVSADAADAEAAAAQLCKGLKTRPTVDVSADTAPARESVEQFQQEAENTSVEIHLYADTSNIEADTQTMLARQNTTSVTAEADVKRAQAQIDALAATVPPVEVPVDANVAKAEAKVAALAAKKATAEVEVTAQIDQAQARIEELTTQRRARVMAIEADMAPIRQQIAALVKQRDEKQIDVTAEITKAEAQLAKLNAQKRGVEVQVDADISRAQAQIDKARAQWEHTALSVDADTAIAQAKLEELRERADEIDGRKLALRADVEGAERAINVLGLLSAGLSMLGAAAPAAAAGLAAVPASLVGIGQVAGAAIAGFNGIGEAVKVMETVRLDNLTDPGATKEQLDKMNDALASLTPAGRQFVTFVSGELLPTMRTVGDSVQAEMLPPIRDALGQLMRLAPQLNHALVSTGQVLGEVAKRSAQLATTPLWSNDFTLVAEANNRIMASLGGAGLALADALRSITAAAMPMLDTFAQWVESQAILVNQFNQTQRASGALGVWFSQMSDRLAEFGAIAVQTATGVAELLNTLAPLGIAVAGMVGNLAELVGGFASANPALTQVIAAAAIALAGFVALGRGIGGVAAAITSARAGWQALAGLMTTWQARATAAGAAMGAVATSMTGSVTAGQRVTTAVGGVAAGFSRLISVVPVAGAVIGGAALALDAVATNADEAANSLLKGGSAAQQAITSINEDNSLTGLGWLDAFGGPGQWIKGQFTTTLDEAKAKANELYTAMTPLQQAQTDLTRAQNDYALAVQQHGPASAAAAQAQQAVAAATDRVEQEQAAAAAATKSHTDRMVEQQLQAISALDKDLALRQALTAVTQAQQQAAAAVAQYGAGSMQATVADQQLEQSMLRAAQAARDKAVAQAQGATANDRDRMATAAFNQTLANLVMQAGTAAPVALRQYLANLNSSALGAIGARMETDRFGHAVLVLPGEKRVFLGVNGADEATARINALRASIEGLPESQWITVYTRQIIDAVQPPPKDPNAPPLPLGNATGGLVQPFATGGIAGLKPMRPVAQVVPPQTWRVVGDRMRGDEAYIPVNNSARSQAILAKTASRMGYALLPKQQQLVGMASGGLVGRPVAYNNTTPPPRVLPRDGKQMVSPAQQVWSPQITVHARTGASPEHIAHAVDRHLRIRSRL
ncbi:hypothetical protein E1161_13330 [Saccharopolyspora aridisoli]|uniref:Uncharacterized protein n=1 Tax=Saccharopolyspora aridisoli TaxID=2530385 RepID=A0A4R4UL30_9PSEU|nr:hypothetical protein [Saccharopolyspora aridisoli]TDC92350.1 hypothetical protein E1161_13330 [Saccharopolyspora aridisoli]